LIQLNFFWPADGAGEELFVPKIAATGLAVMCLLLFALPMSAQLIPHGNVYIGAAYGKSDVVTNRYSFRGWNGSAEFIPLSRFPHIGLVADGGGLYRSGITQYNILGGVRLSYSFGKARPFVHGLAGEQRVNSNGNHYQSTAWDLGGGLDYKLFFRNFSWRVQADYVHANYLSAQEGEVRASTGLVFRF
jgi:hypothetical protein